MKTSTSLHNTFLFSLIFISFFSVGVITYFWISNDFEQLKSESRGLREKYVASQKAQIREEVERVLAYIQYKRDTTENDLKKNIMARVYEADFIAENLYKKYKDFKNTDEIKELIKEALRPIRFNNGRGYFFVYDMKGKNILLPASPDLEGKNLWDLQDSKGLFTIRRFIQLIKEKQKGFLKWHWYRPGDTENMSEKIGFAKYFAPMDWWIGTGEYVRDFEKDVQKETLDWINKIRYGKNGYIFVYDFNAITLAHYKPGNMGKNQWTYTDPNGIPVVQELIRLSKNKEGGYLEYLSTIRPSTGMPAKKIGYARSVQDWKWMVGTGVYIDDIEATLLQKRLGLHIKIKHNIIKTLIILACSLLSVFFIAAYISRQTMKNIIAFSSFFEKSATESVKIEDETIHFSEFKGLAIAANHMVDERNRVQNFLLELQEQLNRSKKMEALGLLAGGVAHDLNNVLSGIVSYPELILMDLPEESNLRKPILTIKESGLKAAAIVQDLLTLARRGVIQKDVLNLNNIISVYLESPEFHKLIDFHPDINIITNLATDLLNITGAPVHLNKTIMNLVSNAAESQPEGGQIVISTENRYVDSPIQGYDIIREGDFVVLQVKDRGIGIPAEDLKRIFEPFYTKKVMGRSGTGLGMAVVWGSVQDHEGYINVDSTQGKGTSFELYFPATREKSPEDQVKINSEDYRGNNESILVVDDVKNQREIVKEMLGKLGYRVITVSSGKKAVNYIKSNKVDLIILDMIMDPGIDGLETFQRIIKIHPDQKAIIASGFAETGRVRELQKLGICQYVQKPYTIEKIGMAVKQELERREK